MSNVTLNGASARGMSFTLQNKSTFGGRRKARRCVKRRQRPGATQAPSCVVDCASVQRQRGQHGCAHVGLVLELTRGQRSARLLLLPLSADSTSTGRPEVDRVRGGFAPHCTRCERSRCAERRRPCCKPWRRRWRRPWRRPYSRTESYAASQPGLLSQPLDGQPRSPGGFARWPAVFGLFRAQCAAAHTGTSVHSAPLRVLLSGACWVRARAALGRVLRLSAGRGAPRRAARAAHRSPSPRGRKRPAAA